MGKGAFGNGDNTLQVTVSGFTGFDDGKHYLGIYVGRKCVYFKKQELSEPVSISGGIDGIKDIKVKVKQSKLGHNPTKFDQEVKEEEAAGFNGKLADEKEGTSLHLKIVFQEGVESKKFKSCSESD
mmetsp:Transcript_16379/g.42236  ORF Transcript_16379/g.42236 Transcript_16379/m.42236 type:complete len:126 (+) Transcript_16379:161-538(+)|eukprot:CAMPEP_0174892450 /NCGR_PEP_ID=MMETSP0167-20121228/7393_1 /TAXON_ID=38298 /ORGANISM="Rhodella maculata, Strain CCMP736" /LENGTH=125 /DNA_ID=CAMNT_0016130951 /DNA_START=83 /DNA_END=460 /DNA_ORIENTATION=+